MKNNVLKILRKMILFTLSSTILGGLVTFPLQVLATDNNETGLKDTSQIQSYHKQEGDETDVAGKELHNKKIASDLSENQALKPKITYLDVLRAEQKVKDELVARIRHNESKKRLQAIFNQVNLSLKEIPTTK